MSRTRPLAPKGRLERELKWDLGDWTGQVQGNWKGEITTLRERHRSYSRIQLRPSLKKLIIRGLTPYPFYETPLESERDHEAKNKT